MRTVAILFLFVISTRFLLAQNPGDSLQTQIQLRTYLKNDQVPLNGEVEYQIELSWQGALNRYHIQKIDEPVVTNLKIRGSGSSNRFYTDQKGHPHSVKLITYYLTPLEMGMAYIDGVTIRYKDNVSGQDESLMSQRLGVKIIEPLRQSGKNFTTGQILVVIIGLLFILILVYFLWRYFSIRRRQKVLQEEPEKTLEENIREELKNLFSLKELSFDERFSKLQKILNRYLRQRFRLEGLIDSKVAQQVLADQIEEDLLQKVRKMYDRSELARFAGDEITESEFQLFYDTVELLLDRMNAKAQPS